MYELAINFVIRQDGCTRTLTSEEALNNAEVNHYNTNDSNISSSKNSEILCKSPQDEPDSKSCCPQASQQISTGMECCSFYSFKHIFFLSYFASDAYLSSNFSPISYYIILRYVITEFLQSVELMIENKMEALAFFAMPSIFHQG